MSGSGRYRSVCNTGTRVAYYLLVCITCYIKACSVLQHEMAGVDITAYSCVDHISHMSEKETYQSWSQDKDATLYHGRTLLKLKKRVGFSFDSGR